MWERLPICRPRSVRTCGGAVGPVNPSGRAAREADFDPNVFLAFVFIHPGKFIRCHQEDAAFDLSVDVVDEIRINHAAHKDARFTVAGQTIGHAGNGSSDNGLLDLFVEQGAVCEQSLIPLSRHAEWVLADCPRGAV